MPGSDASPPPSRENETATPEQVIPPGQEVLVAQMCGRGATLPAGCVWDGAQIDHARIFSSYACPGGPVKLELDSLTAASPDALRTARFAIHVASGDAPAELVPAIVARVREREAGFQWSTPERGDGASGGPEGRPRAATLAVVAAVSLLVACVGIAVWVRRRRRASNVAADGAVIGPSRTGSTRSTIVSAGGALACVAGVHAMLHAFGTALLVPLQRGGVATTAGVVGLFAGGLLAVMVGLFAITRARHPWSARRFVLAAAVVYLPIAFVARNRPLEGARFGEVMTYAPSTTFVDRAPARPELTYATNALGLRSPDFALVKAKGAIRVGLIGDSYVFGMGVRDEDTLSARVGEELHRRGREIEVLNLGVPGDNLASHVDVFEAARDKLDLDAAVVCLTLANDLSRWDVQEAQRARRRVGLFSLAETMFGRGASVIFDALLLESTVTPAGLAHLDAQLARLDALASRPPPVRTLLFTYGPVDAPIEAAFKAHPSLGRVRTDVVSGNDFIAGDGHPNAAGNRRFAVWIADALERALPPR